VSRGDRFLRFAMATIAVSPALLAGCAALTIHRAKEPIARVADRPRLIRLAVAQLQYGNNAPFQVCIGDACPQPTTKTRASAPQHSNADVVVVPVDLPTDATASPKPAAMLVRAETSQPPLALVRTKVTITFGSGAAMLNAAARKTLDAVMPEARTADTIEIRGRTDALGGAQLNEALARNRAFAVRDYLHQQQLPEHTLIRVSSKGACCYVGANDTAEGRAANRRVEIEFTRAPAVAFGSNRNDRL